MPSCGLGLKLIKGYVIHFPRPILSLCQICQVCMMTSSNGNIFRVTGPLCGEFTSPGEFLVQRPVTRSFHVFFDLRLNKRLSKQPRGWWFETPSWSLWRHGNGRKRFWCERQVIADRVDLIIVINQNPLNVAYLQWWFIVQNMAKFNWYQIDGLMQNCSISIANELEIQHVAQSPW